VNTSFEQFLLKLFYLR